MQAPEGIKRLDCTDGEGEKGEEAHLAVSWMCRRKKKRNSQTNPLLYLPCITYPWLGGVGTHHAFASLTKKSMLALSLVVFSEAITGVKCAVVGPLRNNSSRWPVRPVAPGLPAAAKVASLLQTKVPTGQPTEPIHTTAFSALNGMRCVASRCARPFRPSNEPNRHNVLQSPRRR